MRSVQVKLSIPCLNGVAPENGWLYDVSWKLLEAFGEHRAARLTRPGVLEFMVPLEEHENPSDLVVSSFILWSKSWLESQSLASTTPEAERFEEGAEPDKCYYIKTIRSWGRTVNRDPPRLGGGSGHTHRHWQECSVCKMAIPELWRYDGRLSEFINSRWGSIRVANSPIFPGCRRSSTGFWSSAKLREKLRLIESSASARESSTILAPAQTPLALILLNRSKDEYLWYRKIRWGPCALVCGLGPNCRYPAW